MESPRHPRCIRPLSEVGSGIDFAAKQAARITEILGQLASARGRIVDLEKQLDAADRAIGVLEDHGEQARREIGRLKRESHDLANRVQKAEGALELLAIDCGLPATAKPPEVLEAVRRRMR